MVPVKLVVRAVKNPNANTNSKSYRNGLEEWLVFTKFVIFTHPQVVPNLEVWKSKATVNCLVSNILHTLFCAQKKKGTQFGTIWGFNNKWWQNFNFLGGAFNAFIKWLVHQIIFLLFNLSRTWIHDRTFSTAVTE